MSTRKCGAGRRDRAPRPSEFRTLGQPASMGRRSGVANSLGVDFPGSIAWWLWRTLDLLELPRFERKLRVALYWKLDLLFTKDLGARDFESVHSCTGLASARHLVFWCSVRRALHWFGDRSYNGAHPARCRASAVSGTRSGAEFRRAC